MATDTSERSFEDHVCKILTGQLCDPPSGETVGEIPVSYGGVGWGYSNPHDYNQEYCVDVRQLNAFLRATQHKVTTSLAFDQQGLSQSKFLKALQDAISKHGTVYVLRNGITYGHHRFDLFYGTPTPGNKNAERLFKQNRFTVTRQLYYSPATRHSLDIGLFINGLPIATFELKNKLTRQSYNDAIVQYQHNRDPQETLFECGRCLVHFAVDEDEAYFCTHLQGTASQFMPFNRGLDDGAGNPPNPDGRKTDYLWREVLERTNFVDILENYTQVVEEKDKRKMVWPRYHQFDLIHKLLADIDKHGVGERYLIQHSAGSGKSNSIAWLALRLIGLERKGAQVFDSIIVVTDRVILDKQIEATIKQFTQMRSTVGHAERSGDLREFIKSGKKVIISTVQKFPFILDEIGNEHRSRHFAIIIDEAHSSQGGKTSGSISQALSKEGGTKEEEMTTEDKIIRLMKGRRLLSNASYFAFTATPKNKTLEIFGTAVPQPDGAIKRRAFHMYTMKQAIQENFILDVLVNYTPVKSYYKLMKTIERDPTFEPRRAHKKLRRFVEGHKHVIELKSEIMVDHFHEQVIARNKIDGKARAMVVTDRVAQAIKYYRAISAYLRTSGSDYKAIVAFSDTEIDGKTVTESSLNGFPSGKIADRFREEPYRFLICADKFQTGFDAPLLHTMYVDKTLSGVKAVQTLSRLNRAYPGKHDVFVLDFRNMIDTISNSFAPFYRTTILADETNPNRLYDLQKELDNAGVYSFPEVKKFAQLWINGADRDRLDPILDICVERYLKNLDEDGQVKFKGSAKTFIRNYYFLSTLLVYTNDVWKGWEKRSIFLDFLVNKLPAPQEEDFSRDILDMIDMESYRVEKQAMQKIIILDKGGEVDPLPSSAESSPYEPTEVRLKEIIDDFNRRFGNISWKGDSDRAIEYITREIPQKMKENDVYRNAIQYSDKQNVQVECNKVLEDIITSTYSDEEFYKHFADNENFKRWVQNTVFELTYYPQQKARG